MKVFFTIKDGQLIHKSSVKKAFDLKDGTYELEIKKRSRRSLSQNAYYWACVVPLVKEGLVNLGHEINLEETHSFLKSRFNIREIIDFSTGEVLSIPQSTTSMTKDQFCLYVADIQQFAAEYLSIAIPNPNEPILINY